MPSQATVETFRRRLAIVLDRHGGSHAAFARAAGLDRSTLSQLLHDPSPRLPRSETLIAIAGACRVSVDWLLGLSQREEIGAEIIEAVMQIEPTQGAPLDDCMLRWLREAEGYRVRTVPSALPDFLKTEDVLRHEYVHIFAADPRPALDGVAARLALTGGTGSDHEVCCAQQAVVALARGEGQWKGLPRRVRAAQLDYMAGLVRDLYPGLRLYLYDLRRTWSVPFTVFGPRRVAVFLGPSFLVLNSAEHVALFTRRFDDLIRAARVQPHAVAEEIARARRAVRS